MVKWQLRSLLRHNKINQKRKCSTNLWKVKLFMLLKHGPWSIDYKIINSIRKHTFQHHNNKITLDFWVTINYLVTSLKQDDTHINFIFTFFRIITLNKSKVCQESVAVCSIMIEHINYFFVTWLSRIDISDSKHDQVDWLTNERRNPKTWWEDDRRWTCG